MLDFAFLQKQLNAMVIDQQSVRRRYADKVTLAQQTLVDWSERWQELGERAEESRTSWLLATDIHEPLPNRHPLPACPKQMTAIATDGSQIFPDRHELIACYLINIGIVVLHYGTGERPMLTNRPRLFYSEREMYQDWDGERLPVNEEIISARRGAFEIQELVHQAEQTARGERKIVGLSDGSLILWMLEKKSFKQEILQAYLHSFEQLRALQIPVMGYISRPQGADVINVLRVGLCPEELVNCDRCPYKSQKPELPCEPIKGVMDAVLFAPILQQGERSSVFRSKSTILDEYGPHAVYFCYLNVGAEIVRIEIPQWVSQNSGLLDIVHATAYDQAQKGQGYPVSLAEAHEQAVIRGNEREQFYRLLEQLYVRQGLEVNLSRKFIKKRNVGI